MADETKKEEPVDDRIFSADDMWNFAFNVAQAAMAAAFEGKKNIDGESLEDHITTRVALEEGDGSYETYVVPEKYRNKAKEF